MDPHRISWGPVDPTRDGAERSVVGACGPVLVMATSARPSVESMDMLGRRVIQLKERHPAGVFLLVAREQFAGTPAGQPLPEDARRRGRELLDQLGRHVSGISYVYEGGGFAAAIVRMTFRALVLMSPVPTHIAPTVPEGVGWIVRSPYPTDELRQRSKALAVAVHDLRTKLRLAVAGAVARSA